jgi:50S ribosomal subunit-associated GTPase HflX
LTILVGNKFDDYDPDQLNMQQMNGYASLIGSCSIQVSALTGSNFEHLQFMIADLLMNPT